MPFSPTIWFERARISATMAPFVAVSKILDASETGQVDFSRHSQSRSSGWPTAILIDALNTMLEPAGIDGIAAFVR
jgi:hypothetical protein